MASGLLLDQRMDGVVNPSADDSAVSGANRDIDFHAPGGLDLGDFERNGFTVGQKARALYLEQFFAGVESRISECQ